MTDQINDIIKYNNNFYLLSGSEYILDLYLYDKGITKNDFDNAMGLYLSINSACQRGYVAIWKIESGKLLLDDVRDSTLLRSFKGFVFKSFNLQELIHADWYTGTQTLIGVFNSSGQLLNQSPPSISNITPINHKAEVEIFDEVDETTRQTISNVYTITIERGCIREVSDL